jgi:hypothetical protein
VVTGGARPHSHVSKSVNVLAQESLEGEEREKEEGEKEEEEEDDLPEVPRMATQEVLGTRTVVLLRRNPVAGKLGFPRSSQRLQGVPQSKRGFSLPGLVRAHSSSSSSSGGPGAS